VRHVPDLRKIFSLGTLKAQRCKFSEAGGGIKVTKGSTTSQRRMIGKIVQDDWEHYFWWRFNSNGGHYNTLARLEHMNERGLQTLHKKGALPGIKYCKLSLCKFCIIGRQRRVSLSASQHKTKGLLE